MIVCDVHGTGTNSVLILAEPFKAKSDQALDRALVRGGLKFDDFTVATIPWDIQDGVEFDQLMSTLKPRAVVALGGRPLSHLLPDCPTGIMAARGYTFWSDSYKCWVVPTLHPLFAGRGKTAFYQVILHDIQHAVCVARDGHEFAQPNYLLDPCPKDAESWVVDYEAHLKSHPGCYLSTDIETPDKDSDEEELALEDSVSYLILRCGYSYAGKSALSIPWGGEYTAIHERLLRNTGAKLFWNGSFDRPRIEANQIVIAGKIYDGMDAWHVLNSDLKKSLGFVAPFFCHDQPQWKHLSDSKPAYYNAVDADVAGRIMNGVMEELRKHDLLKVYEEFIVDMDPVFHHMSKRGMPVDHAIRVDSSKRLIRERDDIRSRLSKLVPAEILNLQPKNGYAKTPVDTTGLVEVTFNGIPHKYCPACGERDIKPNHFKSRQRLQCVRCGAKWSISHIKSRKAGNPCEGAGFQEVEINPCVGREAIIELEGERRWAKQLPFVPSTDGVLRYNVHLKRPNIVTGRGSERKETTDEKAIKKLIGRYPSDPFYPLILLDRDVTKTGGTYLGWYNGDTGLLEGGFPVGRDGRIHGSFRHTPSTLRSSMVSPNLQNLPRGGDSDIQKLVKQIFVAPDGHIFVARDFSGIEAVFVGYRAGSKDFTRLASIDIHSYFTGHNLVRLGILTNDDLPSLSWSDADLHDYGARLIKPRFKNERDIGKRCIHAGNYRVGPGKLSEEYPEWFPKPRDAAAVLSFFYELFPEINTWHERLCRQVDDSAVIRNSFGHAHRFYSVLNWEKQGSKWTWSYGDDAKRLIAFGPQSDAALWGKRCGQRLFYNYRDSVGEWLRLFIHDEWLAETPIRRADECDMIMKFEMEKPIPEMPLPASWNMGTNLAVSSEGKRGVTWATMK